jgi:hypothetical protein
LNFFFNGILFFLDLLGLKVQNITIMKNGHFIITYLDPIKKLKKNQFWKILDLVGEFWI